MTEAGYGGTLFNVLQARLKVMLPDMYDASRDDVQPISMGSAGLKFRDDGTVAWDEIWGSFCHLAMAGGPPHRGTLLEPGVPAQIDLQHGRYRQAAAEICRGIRMVTGLEAEPARKSGWVRVECGDAGMAGWLARAIVMENVSARCVGAALLVPAGPDYRLEKEIKNVIVSVAKTRHYWSDHMPLAQRQAVAALFREMETESPLIQAPDTKSDASRGDVLFAQMTRAVWQATGLEAARRGATGWLGVETRGVQPAIWMMRMLAACNVHARREGTVLFVPINPVADADGATVVRKLSTVHALAVEQGVV